MVPDLWTIEKYFNELLTILGIKEPVMTSDLMDYFAENKFKELFEIIAQYMGMPIKVNLQIISNQNNNPLNSSRSKVAEVCIPSNFPLFGSKKMKNFIVTIRMDKNTPQNPDVLFAIITHELSHLLLASIKSRSFDNELYTDIVPFLLGFKEVIRRGRNSNSYFIDGEKLHGKHVTLGYLENDQFDFLNTKVTSVLNKYQKTKQDLLNNIEQVKSKQGNKIVYLLNQIKFLKALLDKNLDREISDSDSLLLVRVHEMNFFDEFTSHQNFLEKKLLVVEQEIYKINHYRDDVLSIFEKKYYTISDEINMGITDLLKIRRAILENLTFFEKSLFLIKFNLKI